MNDDDSIRAGYLRPVFGHEKRRAEVFVDYGEYYYTDGLQPTLGPPEVEPAVSFGMGLRYRFRSFVQFEFGFGVAYVPKTGETILWGTSKRIN